MHHHSSSSSACSCGKTDSNCGGNYHCGCSLQVMKFVINTDTPLLVLGQQFRPGTDTDHFCQPTDVAVINTGDIYVADGSVLFTA